MDLQQLADQLSEEIGRPATVIDAEATGSGDGTALIRNRRRSDAVFELADEGRPPLSPADYGLIDAAASLARDLIDDADNGRTGSSREWTMGRLLHNDGAVRRAAFVEAVSHRWLDRGGRTVVRAVLLDDAAGRLQRVAFGRHLASSIPSRTTFLREQDSVLYLVTREPGADLDLDAAIRAEAERAGVAVVSIGSAPHDPASSDLGHAAEQARIAADLTAALPELQATSSIGELGGWVLLHAVAAGSPRLGDISPAAEQLCRSADSLQRETIETYLDAGGQARTACERLHIHRTTLYYRLENMPQLVREALDDGLKRSTLHLSLKLARLWEATGAL
jgi:hypothetical protein